MILVVANNDLELLALRAAVESLPDGFPPVRAFGGVGPRPGAGCSSLDGARAVLVRLHKGRSAWEGPFDDLRRYCLDAGIALLGFGGEAEIDAELAGLSTVPAGIVTQAAEYWTAGGPANLAQLLRFVADTVLLEGFGFDAPVELPAAGGASATGPTTRPGPPSPSSPTGPTSSPATPCRSSSWPTPSRPGRQRPHRPCYSPRGEQPGGARASSPTPTSSSPPHGRPAAWPATATSPATGDWASPLDVLGVPVRPGRRRHRHDRRVARAQRPASTPLDVTLGVAIPEFDGRIIGPAVRLQGGRRRRRRARPGAVGPPGRALTRSSGSPASPCAWPACATSRRSRSGWRSCCRPTRPSAAASATPSPSTPRRQPARHPRRPADAGYDDQRDRRRQRRGDGRAGRRPRPTTPITLTADRRRCAGRAPAGRRLLRLVRHLPDELRNEVESTWGPAPGQVCVHDDQLAVRRPRPRRRAGGHPAAARLRRGPDRRVPHARSAGAAPLPRLLPVARRRLGRRRRRAPRQARHARVVAGQGAGLSAACPPDAALGDLPLLLPVRRQRPRRGHAGQAPGPRRRHRPPAPAHDPAETYDDLARVEQLLDEYARIQALDPAKLPAIQGRLWGPARHRRARPRPRRRGDARPRRLRRHGRVTSTATCARSRTPRSAAASTCWARRRSTRPLVDSVLGHHPPAAGHGAVAAGHGGGRRSGSTSRRRSPGEVDADRGRVPRPRSKRLAAAGWTDAGDDPTLALDRHRRWCPTCAARPTSSTNLLGGLAGRHVPAGPSGAPTRGGAHVLPTGRNFYSVDPKAVPVARSAWEVGPGSADRLLERHVAETGAVPGTVGHRDLGHGQRCGPRATTWPRCWPSSACGRCGTSTPVGSRASRSSRWPSSGRPRVDVTVRISGFFRDAFPDVVDLLDDAVRLGGLRRRGLGLRSDAGRRGAYGSRAWYLAPSRAGVAAPTTDLAEVYLGVVGVALRARRAPASPPRRRCAAASPPSTSP